MTGEPDGVIGPATLEAVKTYQRSKSLGVDGFPSLTLLKLLQSEAQAVNVAPEKGAGDLAPPAEGTTSSPERVN